MPKVFCLGQMIIVSYHEASIRVFLTWLPCQKLTVCLVSEKCPDRHEITVFALPVFVAMPRDWRINDA